MKISKIKESIDGAVDFLGQFTFDDIPFLERSKGEEVEAMIEGLKSASNILDKYKKLKKKCEKLEKELLEQKLEAYENNDLER